MFFFADDMITNIKESTVLEIIGEFGKVSGYKVKI